MHHRRVPRRDAAPVVTDEEARFVNQLHDVFDDGRNLIRVDVTWLRRVVVAAKVRSDDAESGVGQRGDLLAPRVPELGESVEEDDERA